MRLRTSDNTIYELPRSFIDQWPLLSNLEEACGNEVNVAIPFSSQSIDILVRYGEGDVLTMSEASQIIEYFNADGGEEWRTRLEIDADYCDRRTAYLELGLHLRVTRKFYHIHDWKGYDDDAIRNRPDLDFNILREKASNLDIVSLITGIYYSIYKYGGNHHWEAIALYLPSGSLRYMEEVKDALIRAISSRSQNPTECVPKSRLIDREYSLHLAMFDKTELGEIRCRTADALARVYHPSWRYDGTYWMFFVAEGRLVTMYEPNYSITTHLGTLITTASESEIRLFVTHLIRTKRRGDCISSIGLGGLIGSKRSAHSEVDKAVAEVTGYNCRDIAIVVLESICSSDQALNLIEKRLGEECARIITSMLKSFDTE